MIADFLNKYRPGGPWILVSIAPDKANGAAIQTRTFDDASQAQAWAQVQNQTNNLYFHVNRTNGPLAVKAKKEDIAAVEYLHVDVDCRIGEDFESERERIKALLTSNLPTGIPAPSLVIDSGGGFWGMWRLAEPLKVDGDADKIAKAEAYNIELANRLGGDHCFNLDRIARLPGLTNWPDKKKQSKGRTASDAEVYSHTDAAYPLTAFKPASIGARPATGKPRAAVGVGNGTGLGVDELRAWAKSTGKTLKDSTLARIATGEDPIDPGKYPSRSEALFAVCCDLVRAGADDELIFRVVTGPNEIAASVNDKPNPAKYALEQITRAREKVGALPPMLHPDTPLLSAREYAQCNHPTLMQYNDDWLVHDGAAYTEIEERTVRSELYGFLHEAVTPGKEGEPPRPFNPNKAKVGNVLDALQAIAHRPRDTFAPPCWLEGEGPPARELVACRNGLLHLPTGALHENTPRFFTRNALTFDHDAAAPAPTRWLAFLDSIWSEEPEAIALLQEVFGYLLIPDTSQQKIFMMVGPSRSGKGTIARVLTELVGRPNICAPTLASLSDPFGLEPLVGKQLALMGDVRLGAKTDHAAVAENLLRISGEDTVTANRKYKRSWDGRLAVRFFILTNVMPKFADASSALANRFVPLMMTKSFLGEEDVGLTDKLLVELPGILNWAVEGWRRLRARGHFLPPQSSREAVRDLTELASPAAAFISERCRLEPEAMTPKDEMFNAWKVWCESNNTFPGDKVHFSSKLLAAGNGKIAITKPRADGRRLPCFGGVRLLTGQRTESENERQRLPF